MSENKIKLYIVDDHPLIGKGLSSYFENDPEIAVAGVAANGSDALRYFQNNTADVAVLDINLPDIDGTKLCKQLLVIRPLLKVLALSMFEHGSHIAAMLDNGAKGYMLKDSDLSEIRRAIISVHKGEIYLNSKVASFLKAEVEKKRTAPVLTKREKEILGLIKEGLTNPQMAEKLFLSVETIDTHRKNLYNKLQVNNVATLLRVATENGLI